MKKIKLTNILFYLWVINFFLFILLNQFSAASTTYKYILYILSANLVAFVALLIIWIILRAKNMFNVYK